MILTLSGVNVIQLNWTASTDPVAGYAVYRISLSPVSLAMVFNRLTSGLTTNLTYTDNTVKSGFTYIYFITAWTSLHGSMSHPSNIVSVNVP